MCAACMVEDIELVLLLINLLQTEWRCFYPINGPLIVVPYKTGRVTRSGRVDFHKLTRHVLVFLDRKIQTRTLNLSEVWISEKQKRLAVKYVQLVLTEQHFINNNRIYCVYFALDSALQQRNYLPTSRVQQKVTVMLCMHNIEGV
jgi:hypothetical protein